MNNDELIKSFEKNPISIIIADDHDIFRDGFRHMVMNEKELAIVGEASNGKELIFEIEKIMPDIVITDIKMPIMDGIEATRILKNKYPNIKIIAMSMFDDDNIIIDMLEAGAMAYLLKNSNRSEILEAIKAVNKGNTYYCKNTSAKLVHMIAQSRFDPYKEIQNPQFSNKELDIIKLICVQASNKEIAEKLNLSIRTIEGYKDKIMEKIRAKNAAGIVIYAIKTGIYKI